MNWSTGLKWVNPFTDICGALHNLVSVVQFKKRETLLHGCFSRFVNCADVIRLRNKPHIPIYFNALQCSVEYWTEAATRSSKEKRCLFKFRKINRKTSVSES